MDTRAKIVPYRELSSFIGRDNWVAVIGAFDPLTAVQAERLANSKHTGCKLLAVVLDEEGALLTAEARATLVAALREVDAVSVASQGDVANLPDIEIVSDSGGEKKRTAGFVDFVLRRQAAGQGT